MPSIRGTGQQASSASSYVVPWPSGTIAGDFAVIYCGHAWPANLPSGWMENDNQAGSNWNGAVFSKRLSTTDITAGSVTVTFSGGFNGTLAILTTIGDASVKKTDAIRNSSGSSSVTVSSSVAAATTDLLSYFGSNRAASTNTVSRGALQRQVNDGSNASGCLYTETGVSGTVSPNFLYSTPGSGNYQAIVLLGDPAVVTASRITAPAIGSGAGAKHQPVTAPSTTGIPAPPTTGGNAGWSS